MQLVSSRNREFLTCLLLLLMLMTMSACSVENNEVTYEPTDLHVAANKGELDEVKAILETSPEKDVRDDFGGTALHAAMFQDNVEIVQLLIDYGLDVNAQGTGNGYTPLHDAVWANNLEGVKLLVESGADINIKNNDGETALEKAMSQHKDDIIEYLKTVE